MLRHVSRNVRCKDYAEIRVSVLTDKFSLGGLSAQLVIVTRLDVEEFESWRNLKALRDNEVTEFEVDIGKEHDRNKFLYNIFSILITRFYYEDLQLNIGMFIFSKDLFFFTTSISRIRENYCKIFI